MCTIISTSFPGSVCALRTCLYSVYPLLKKPRISTQRGLTHIPTRNNELFAHSIHMKSRPMHRLINSSWLKRKVPEEDRALSTHLNSQETHPRLSSSFDLSCCTRFFCFGSVAMLSSTACYA